MAGVYDPKNIEKKWQETWEKEGIYRTLDSLQGKENFYTLVEFAYPSGNLHVGHWYAFSVPDIYARYQRMRGKNVLYPIGFDSFGLPAENAAIKRGLDPKAWTYENMETMRAQLRSMGAMFDWDRAIATSDPEYYKWTQDMFTKFFEKDLVYRATTKVNWCPKDQTILANEQVVDGKCERCDTEVVQKDQDQWSFRITKYADRLHDDLENLDWPESIKDSQRSWIGRSEGAEIEFKIKDYSEKIKVFTTRPDTLFGVTYVTLSPEHSLLEVLPIENREEVFAYTKNAKNKSDLERQQSKEKTGVELKGVKAINPANGEEISVWVSDYVLSGYGTGAVMAVPAHDERDFEFAKKYDLPLKKVLSVNMADETLQAPPKIATGTYYHAQVNNLEYDCWPGEGELINSGDFNGLTSQQAKQKITAFVGGEVKKTYRLRDWGISRQRYWGVPIPIVYDPEGKPHSVPTEHLPWLLPTDVDHTPDGTAPLARSKELFERTEKIFGKGWKPEVETMDTFVDSSWYFYRYLDAKNDKEFCSKDKQENWMPIDMYFGGAEHTTMHLLYSRFWNKALFDLGLVKDSEPYARRRNRGLILGPDGNKMSKSKGNVIDPDEVVSRVGADTVRMYLAFMGPYGVTDHYPWDPNGVVGVRRFLERVWDLKNRIAEGSSHPLVHKTIKKFKDDIERLKFNTAISAGMILINELETISKEDYLKFLQILAPFAPHMTEELWREMGETSSIHLSKWPEYDESKIKDEKITIAIQINGKVRDEMEIDPDMSEEDIRSHVLVREKIVEKLAGQAPKKVFYVKGRLINIVV